MSTEMEVKWSEKVDKIVGINCDTPASLRFHDSNYIISSPIYSHSPCTSLACIPPFSILASSLSSLYALLYLSPPFFSFFLLIISLGNLSKTFDSYINIQDCDRKMSLHQHIMVDQILKGYTCPAFPRRCTLPETELSLNYGESIEQTAYRSTLGSLMYFCSGTRPDLSYSVNLLARYSQNWDALDILIGKLNLKSSTRLKVTNKGGSVRVQSLTFFLLLRKEPVSPHRFRETRTGRNSSKPPPSGLLQVSNPVRIRDYSVTCLPFYSYFYSSLSARPLLSFPFFSFLFSSFPQSLLNLHHSSPLNLTLQPSSSPVTHSSSPLFFPVLSLILQTSVSALLFYQPLHDSMLVIFLFISSCYSFLIFFFFSVLAFVCVIKTSILRFLKSNLTVLGKPELDTTVANRRHRDSCRVPVHPKQKETRMGKRCEAPLIHEMREVELRKSVSRNNYKRKNNRWMIFQQRAKEFSQMINEEKFDRPRYKYKMNKNTTLHNHTLTMMRGEVLVQEIWLFSLLFCTILIPGDSL
ncbi:uncharacterized protein VP01_878g1 [Puccinia sorghi]|uniref:Uncharacterized protein n=1 Tax=Puccinia sorghi TaxID=27349 RepID=A0A0L6UAK9_9BASI|nr:uncharacterized protein VP01_878g1 [Puccinia sorghi]